MSFDFSTLVTDRTQADVSRVKQIAEKIKNGTASESELAEFNSAAMKGAYNHTDLNRVTAAMEALKAKLEGYGYAVPGYQRIKVPHVLPEPEPTNRLPEGYTELAWIEGTGTQYINTGFVPNQDTRLVMDFKLFGGTDSILLGARSSSTSDGFTVFKRASGYWAIQYNDTTSNASVSHDSERHVIDKNKNVTYLDGVSVCTHTAGTFTAPSNLCLLATNDAGTVRYPSNGIIYSCQIYDNGLLVRDLVPCINTDGAVGLYDLVTAAFFGNSGTGSFVAGAIPGELLPYGYTQVEYIQSSGTQYIDTGFKPNQTTRVEIEVDVTTNTASTLGVLGCRVTTSGNYFALWEIDGVFKWQYEKQTISSGVTAYGRHTVIVDKSGIMVDGSLSSATEGTISCNYNMLLFAVSTGGTADNRKVSAKLYSCKVYDNGTLVRDFVPCKNSGGVFGLYDIVNATFYQNAGSGAFAAGEEIAASATASVMVTSGNADEYDPYTWYEFDWPTPETMSRYLSNISVIRSVLSVIATTPNVPLDAYKLIVSEANDIEVILLDVYRQLTIMATTFIPCGEALCGGDNL